MLNRGPKKKIAVAVSGKGRTLQNFLKGSFAFEVGAVISSKPDAAALDLAKAHGIPVFVDNFKNINAKALDSWLLQLGIQWIALAGFLKPFPTLPSFTDRVINIHPSLLPSYGGHGMYGMKVHEAVMAAKEQCSGATVHFVNERYDEGSVIAQIRSDIHLITNAQDLADHVFALECHLYPEVLTRLLNQQLPLAEGQTWFFEKV
ncbi:MAG: phosphoribosylglycinamide formyltransferase [Oligoflexus sp.]|nr:phosphoribosylglycinamide formyltransferase [Oligoflexus sp.]